LVFLKNAVTLKSAVDAWDVLECSKVVANFGLHLLPGTKGQKLITGGL